MIYFSFSLSYIQIYLITISSFSFILYTYDKLQSLKNSRNASRVSEKKLLFSSLIGGTLGSIFAMLIFRHKSKKPSFIIKLLVVIIIQIVLVFLHLKGII